MSLETINTSWNRSTNPYIDDIEVIKGGDKDGLGMVVRCTVSGALEVNVISLRQHSHSRTGPTWAYLTNIEGWTLIDAGARGALGDLEYGMGLLGLKLTDLKRVVITHGHQDHDGNAYDLIKASGAELWAHELYFKFLRYSNNHANLDIESPLHKAMYEIRNSQEEWYRRQSNEAGHAYWQSHIESYTSGRNRILDEQLPIHPIHDGEQLGDLRFMYTPGHAIDEICIGLKGTIFTGDHVLPQISPHPTFKQTYPETLHGTIPSEYQESWEHYGLMCYLKSLGKVLALDRYTTVFPAHRLFNHNRFNIRNLRRAQDIVRHHLRRLDRLVEVIVEGADTSSKATQRLFPPRKLSGGGFFAAVSEVVSHLELLADAGDIAVSEDGRLAATGTTRYREEIQRITAV